ncbi:MAG: adenine phosphoribosyltransferase [Alphaproteobacteria bacterium]
MKDIKDYIRTIPDYPHGGILFRDITTLLGDPKGFEAAVEGLVEHARGTLRKVDHVAGIEARGFIVGGAVAHRLKAGFIPVRKKGKLPWKTIGQEYQLEYGKDSVEIHIDAVKKGDQVLLVDDLIATGGTAEAAIKLIERAGANVAACSFVIDLPELGGRARLEAMGKPVLTLCSFEGK